MIRKSFLHLEKNDFLKIYIKENIKENIKISVTIFRIAKLLNHWFIKTNILESGTQNYWVLHWMDYFKGCVHYIFTILFCMTEREELWNR